MFEGFGPLAGRDSIISVTAMESEEPLWRQITVETTYVCSYDGEIPEEIWIEDDEGVARVWLRCKTSQAVLKHVNDAPDPFDSLIDEIVNGTMRFDYQPTVPFLENLTDELEKLREKLEKGKKYADIYQHVQSAAGNLNEVLRGEYWVNPIFLLSSEGGMDLLVEAVSNLQQAVDELSDGKKPKQKARDIAEVAGLLCQGIEKILTDGQFFALGRGMSETELTDVVTLHNVGCSAIDEDDYHGGALAYAAAYYIVHDYGPDKALWAPVLDSPGLTNEETPEFTGGLTTPDVTIELFIDGLPAGTAIADESGEFAVTIVAAVGDGVHTAFAVAIDPLLGSVHSAPVDFEVDTFTPIPWITSPVHGSDENVADPVITGTGADPGVLIAVVTGWVVVGETVSDAFGEFSYPLDFELTPGENFVFVMALDEAGNQISSEPAIFTVGPAVPVPVITYPDAWSAVPTLTPEITGNNVLPGSSVEVIIDYYSAGFGTADGTGNFTFEVLDPLEGGEHNLYVVGTNINGEVEVSDVINFEANE